MRRLLTAIMLLCGLSVSAQHTVIDSLAMYHEATALNSGKIQQEMIYLHLDNTSYYRGDRIFFACYLVTSGQLKPSNLSQTVYVELLNPNGKIIDRCVLKSEDGRCNGSLLVDETPFYSGYYEIRAYTRYMLNFGSEAIYSRVLPVFATPAKEGDWADRRMLKYGSKKHPFSRPKPVKIVDAKPDKGDVEIAVSSDSDSVALTVSSPTCAVLGVSLTCRGELCGRAILDIGEEGDATFKIARVKLPSGVIMATIFDAEGNPVAERLFFNDRHDFVAVEYEFDKQEYAPYEPVDLTIRLSEPVTFSLSVTDADNHVAAGTDIRSELLLASELRGFVPNLAGHMDDADSLLNRLGRCRYPWSRLAGMEPTDIKALPEQGIEVRGSVQGQWRNKGKSGVTVTAMLSTAAGSDSTETFIDEFITDSIGGFAFRTDIYGDWMLSLSATEKGKRKRHRILLDRSERPAARAYDVEEMQYAIDRLPVMITEDADSDDEDLLRELERRGVKRLKEVEVTADGGHAADVRQYVENAVASYDVAAARNLLQDSGKKFIRRLSDILPLIDPNFILIGGEFCYGNKLPLYVIDNDLADNNKVLEYSDIDSSNPADLSVDMVKNIYVNTQPQAITEYGIKYLENRVDLMNDGIPERLRSLVHSPASADRDTIGKDYRSSYYRSIITAAFGCVIFVELNTANAGFIRPGMRRTLLEGYTVSDTFSHADYHAEPPVESDFRRTLYWNPQVTPDENGVAHIRFYNNSIATRFNVNAAAITPSGTPTASPL